MVTVTDIEELLALMEHWGVGEMHLTVQDASVDLVRLASPGEGVVTVGPVELPGPPPASAEPLPGPEPVTIHAPVVGVFHLARQQFPQDGPQPGDPVQAGQVIGAIELMHVPYDLVSPVSGVIQAILADDDAGVEYGQPLMLICPLEEVGEDETESVSPPPR